MAKFRKKPVVIEATQWHRNGDHPADYDNDEEGEERRKRQWEGAVVRYYRHPNVPGADVHVEADGKGCGFTFHDHGWIETLEGGHIVCPGDWIITGVEGELYPCKPSIFAATYELVDEQEPAST